MVCFYILPCLLPLKPRGKTLKLDLIPTAKGACFAAMAAKRACFAGLFKLELRALKTINALILACNNT